VHRIGPGPVLQYRPSLFQTAPESSDRMLLGQLPSPCTVALSVDRQLLVPRCHACSTRRACSRHPVRHCRGVGPWEMTSLFFPRQPLNDATPLPPRHLPLLLRHHPLVAVTPPHLKNHELSRCRAPATPPELAIAAVPRPPSTAVSGAPPASSTLPVALPKLRCALQPHQSSQPQPADYLTGAPLRPIVIAATSPRR
jgi:hypothetical protein